MAIVNPGQRVKAANWPDLELRHLEYALAVNRHQGFVPAAIALDLDQGFLSRQIQRLEHKLGFKLFDRRTRPLSTTEAGQVFLREAEHILTRTHKVVELAHTIQSGQRGQLNLGVNTSIANSLLPEMLSAFQHQFPDVDLVLHELPSYNQIQHLRDRQIDIGFFHSHNLRSLASDDHEFETLPIYRETFLAVLPERHPLAQQPQVSLSKLDGEPFVMPPRSLMNGLRDQIDQLCLIANCRPVVVQEAAWLTTTLSLVAGDMGVAILPANAKSLQRAGVVYREIEKPCPSLELLAVRDANNPSPILQSFFNWLERLYA